MVEMNLCIPHESFSSDAYRVIVVYLCKWHCLKNKRFF